MSNPQPESTPKPAVAQDVLMDQLLLVDELLRATQAFLKSKEPAAASDVVVDQPPPLINPDEEDHLKRYRPLYHAALKGDWEAAESIFLRHPDASMARITSRGETALHVATNVGRTEFIEKLVEAMPPEALEIKEHDLGRTALHYAAIYGNLRIVKTLVTKNGKLTEIVDRWNHTPLDQAAYYFASKEVVWYLILKVPDVLPDPQVSPFFAGGAGGDLIASLITSHSYDICLHLLDKYPFLATAKTKNREGMLSWFALRPSGFPSGSKLGFWESCIYQLIPTEFHRKPPQLLSRSDLEDQRAKEPPTLPQYPVKSYLSHVMHWINGASWTAIEYLVPGIKHIKDKKYKHKCTQKMVEIACEQIARWNEKDIISFFTDFPILRAAAQSGAVELITTCLQHFPYLIGYDQLLEQAVLHRQERVFNLFLGETVYPKEVAAGYDGETNENLAHKAARLAPFPRLSSVSCPALQMQRELQWFKAVEKLVNPTQRLCRNKMWETPREIFTTEHRELLKDAERWMKDTSNSCMVVSTLIATVVFAAAFTVPGGNVEGKGIPLFLDDVVFLLFAASDALALFSSTTSILMFLSILTARYAEDDFLRALPKRLILGFASLFLAIATLMVAFGATLYMVLSVRFKWIFILIIAVTTIPVALYGMLQLPLFIYMVRSTYGSGIFHPERIW